MIENTYENFNLSLESIGDAFATKMQDIEKSISKLSKGMTFEEANEWIK
jgi:hypothetical protein